MTVQLQASTGYMAQLWGCTQWLQDKGSTHVDGFEG